MKIMKPKNTSSNEENNNEEDELEIPAFFEKTKKLMFFEKIDECHYKSGKKTFSSIT